MTPDDHDSDLSWTAFRYLVGELNAADRDAFEARLAIDPSAAAEVSRAVALIAACGRLDREEIESRAGDRRSPRTGFRTIASWAVGPLVATAAAVAIAWLSGVGSPRLDPEPAGPGPGAIEQADTEHDHRAVLDAWTLLRRDEPEPALDPLAEPALSGWETEAGGAISDPVSAISSRREGEDEPVVPSWLIAAASLSGDPAGPSDPLAAPETAEN